VTAPLATMAMPSSTVTSTPPPSVDTTGATATIAMTATTATPATTVTSPIGAAAIRNTTAPTATPATPRWTLKRLVIWVKETFDTVYCRETIRAALHRLKLSWKKGKKLLSRADPAKRAEFVATIRQVLERARRDEELLVYIDEAHIHQDADMGYGWSVRGERLWVCSSSPGLSAKVSFYGLYLYNEGEVRIWDYPRGNSEHTVDVFTRLREEFPSRKIRVIWDGASYHRSGLVKEAAARLAIEVEPLPGYSPDFMPVEALWRWLREDVTYNRCHTTRDELIANVRHFEAMINSNPIALADRLWVKDTLDPKEEKLRIPR
jgi:transposase